MINLQIIAQTPPSAPSHGSKTHVFSTESSKCLETNAAAFGSKDEMEPQNHAKDVKDRTKDADL